MFIQRGFKKRKVFEIVAFGSEHVHGFDNLFLIGNVESSHLFPHIFEVELSILLTLDDTYNRDSWLLATDT